MNLDENAPSVLGTGAASPGETLRVARQLAGLSQEDIAGKLKLSPRQIAAIESGDWSALPERTFTRGFMRNYARLVGVDPDTLGLDRSPLQAQAGSQLKPTPEAIGEIAQEADRNGLNAARWLVPSLLIAALVAGVLYFQGGRWFGWDMSKILATSTATPSLKSAVAAKAESATEKADALASPSSASASTLSAPASSSGAVIAPAGSPAATAGQGSAVVAPAVEASPLAPVLRQASPSPTPAPAAVGERRISLTFKGKSWTEVRSKGDVIFSETAQPGTREFNGAVPLSFTVGNASTVTVAIDGKPFDMTELTRNDVARFRVE